MPKASESLVEYMTHETESLITIQRKGLRIRDPDRLTVYERLKIAVSVRRQNKTVTFSRQGSSSHIYVNLLRTYMSSEDFV